MRVLLACSASGGHIIPALSVAEALRRKESRAEIFILTENNQVSAQILDGLEFQAVLIDPKLKFNLGLQIANSAMKLLINCIKIFKTVKELDPDVIVGFGGYLSLVPVLFSKLYKIPCLIHEQNVILGKTNRFLSGFIRTIAVSFKDTKEALKKSKIWEKIIYTGLPLRSSLKQYDKAEAANFFKLDANIFTILVLGGSSGSAAINRIFLTAVDDMRKKENLQVIHICGFRDEANTRVFYKNHPNLKARIYPFLKEMSFAFSLADICISRSGASAIYELSFFKLPSIFIPYPYAGGHQFANADVLAKTHAAVLIDEKDAKFQLSRQLDAIFDEKAILANMKGAFRSDLIFDAAERLSEIIIKSYETK